MAEGYLGYQSICHSKSVIGNIMWCLYWRRDVKLCLSGPGAMWVRFLMLRRGSLSEGSTISQLSIFRLLNMRH